MEFRKGYNMIIFFLAIMLGNLYAVEESKMSFSLSSTAFQNGAGIPSVYTCEGANISPPLSWQNAPSETKTFVLICEDPDAPAGTWTHWVLYNIPNQMKGLSENISKQAHLADGSMQGINDFKQIGYGGPCPPSGTHRYYFKLYALNTHLSLPPKATKAQVEQAIEGHILQQTELMGIYKKAK